MSFVWDEEFRLFRREDYVSLPYSDGPEVERRLYDVVLNARDRSTLSTELAASISDWPSEYHLSRSRHCLLRPLGIAPGHKVLELGCGCGAITRYLGEIGAEVVAVEGSLLRARIAAERCRDLPNVKIFADDLLAFETEQKFDWVLLIGVLEYAPAFSTEQDEVLHYLNSTCRFLSPAGKLVLAIENKLGLKYFNGCGEDHTGIPFSGVQDLYQRRTVRTFGRRELTTLLSAAGLPHTYFHYPFPDYKLPVVVLSEDALTDPGFDPVDLLVRCQARDYSGWPYRAFDEALVFPSLHNNGLLADLSNSFLVVATAESESVRSTQELAVAFSVNRSPQFATQTKFVRYGSEIRVSKERLTPLAPTPIVVADRLTLTSQLDAAAYRQGRQLLWNLLKARARSGELEVVVQALHPWMEFLLQHAHVSTALIEDTSAKPSNLATYVLPGDFVDCIPFNLLDTGGELFAIDLEWRSGADIPLGWVVTRGILWSLACGVPVADHLQSVSVVIEALCQRFEFSVQPSDIRGWLEMEASFQAKVLGDPSQAIITQQTSSGMRSVVNEIQTLHQSVATLDRQIADLDRALVGRDQRIADLNREIVAANREIVALNREIVAVNHALIGRDAQIATLNEILARRDQAMSHLISLQAQTRGQLTDRTAQLNDIVNSRSWKLASSLRSAKRHLAALGPRRFRPQRQLVEDRQLVAASGIFDPAWYLLRNTDVAKAGIDPIEHYLSYGGIEGRDPGPLFSSKKYLEQNPDVQASAMNPLVHYLRFGVAEGRTAEPSGGETGDSPSSGTIQEAQKEWDSSGHARVQALLASDERICVPAATDPILSIILVLRNKAHLSLLSIESIIANADVPFELIIVDNASTDDTPRLLERMDGAKILRNSTNIGFGPACMQAAAEANGEFLCFFNNDALLLPNALAIALKNFSNDSSVGVVGGKILLANASLQEAGSIIWSDGSALGYGRGDDPNRPQYSFRRPVDYCSGAFLFTPTRLFLALGGFSPHFYPAYYEDADYCLTVWQNGLRVIYEPEAVIRHYESASSGGNDLARTQMATNQSKFVEKWHEVLTRHYPPVPENIPAARISVASDRLRILYIDDRIPHNHLGSGLPRSNYILSQLVRMGHQVACASFTFPLEDNEYSDVPREVELFDGFGNRDQLLQEYAPHCDVIWISRPHNMRSFLESAAGGLASRKYKIVYDAEAIFAEREQLKAKIVGEPARAQVAADASHELALAAVADIVVVVSEKDRQTMLAAGIKDVCVLGFQISPDATPATFDERSTFLFVGAMHGVDNPNADSMRYFCRSIWPSVRAATSSSLIVVGSGTDVVVGDLNTDNVRVLGAQEDLTPYYNDARVFVVPTRYAAGMPYKAYEAAARGVPMVVSDLIANQIKWRDGEDYLTGGNPKSFADSCCRLYANQQLWQILRANALARAGAELGEQAFVDALTELFNKLSTLGVRKVREAVRN